MIKALKVTSRCDQQSVLNINEYVKSIVFKKYQGTSILSYQFSDI
jgi:hypothetical protein